MKMTGNTILITGATSGIGRALAEAFHDRGNRVIVTGRRQSLLDQITAERPDMIGLTLDLADPSSLPHFSAEIRAKLSRAQRADRQRRRLARGGHDDRRLGRRGRGSHRRDQHSGRAARHRSGPAAPERAAERDDHGDQLEPRLRAPRRLSDLLCQQGVPALLASVAAASASQDPHRGAGARTALCADRAHRRATGARYARDAASTPISRRSCNCWSCGLIPAARCWSSATAPAAGPSATAATRPPSRP